MHIEEKTKKQIFLIDQNVGSLSHWLEKDDYEQNRRRKYTFYN